MQKSRNTKFKAADIGYHGKPLDTLSREELLEAFVELSQQVFECASVENTCKSLISVNRKS